MSENKHEKNKKTLKILGICVLSVGAIFALIGFINFFSSIGTEKMPTLFWCLFLGIPMLAIGLMLTMMGFQREMNRYVKNENVPVFNEMGKEIAPGMSAMTSAVKDGFSDKYICPACGEPNDTSAKFCRHCGKNLTKTCPYCGKELPADSIFCDGCGKKLD